MPTPVFLNGRFVPMGEALVSAFDAGLQHGVGLFETVGGGTLGGEPALLDLEEHAERLARSARELGLSSALRAGALAEAAMETLRRSELAKPGLRVRVRMTVTGGDLNMLARRMQADADPGSAARAAGGSAPMRPTHDATVLVHAQPAAAYPREMFERGVAVVVADWKANPLDAFQSHKTLNYWPRLRELQVASGRGAAEALVFQVTNHLSGGCVSNAFAVVSGVGGRRLVTPMARTDDDEDAGEPVQQKARGGENGGGGVGGPRLPSPVLPGVTRAWVINWAERNGVGVERRLMTIEDCLGAEELFLTNSSWGVLPVVRVEGHVVGGGRPGALTRELVQAWGERLDEPG